MKDDVWRQWSKKWPAPAKLNLMLRIVGQRDDGYHLLQTVFQMTDLCDWLIFHQNETICLKKPLEGVAEQDDLTIRAAQLLKTVTGYQGGVCIEVEKNLPMGGGLGGGSSDAATTLVVLNHLWKTQLSIAELMTLGLSLGADVPVFVNGCSAWAEGVGEILKNIIVEEQWVVIIKPNCHVDTKAIFCAKDLTRDSKTIKMEDFLAGQVRNDCLEVVKQRYSEVGEALKVLSEFGEARLTGTGACVFAQFENKAVAENAFKALKSNWQVYLTQGLNVSPLYEMLRGLK